MSLSSVVVTPDLTEVRIGEMVTLTATATYSDGSTEDATGRAVWSATSMGGSAAVAGGVVSGVSPGQVQITAELDGKMGSAALRVLPARVLVVSNFQSQNISVFPVTASGDVAPTRRIAGPATGLNQPRGLVVVDDEIILADQGANAIDFFPIDATGNVAPTRRLFGGNTRLSGPVGVNVLGDELFVIQFGSVLVFPRTASGDVAPIREFFSVEGAQHAAIHDGELYVVSSASGSVQVFPLTASGNPTPARTITGAQVGLSSPAGITIHGDELFVTDTRSGTDEIRVFPVTASGDVAPRRVIAGPNTGLGFPDQLFVFGNELFVGNYDTNSVRVFPLAANGDVLPTRSIVGPSTGFGGTLGVFVY
ncbi:MAG: hypothetical protein ACTHU0_11460 [Kofleriaceae bacterium]